MSYDYFVQIVSHNDSSIKLPLCLLSLSKVPSDVVHKADNKHRILDALIRRTTSNYINKTSKIRSPSLRNTEEAQYC